MRLGSSSPGVLLLLCVARCQPGPVPADSGSDAGADTQVPFDAPSDTLAEAALEAAPDAAPSACDLATEPRIETLAMLDSGRYSPLAELLLDGRVLLAGGYDFASGADESAQSFDPATNALAYLGSMQQARNFPASALLADGTVLVAGGFHQTAGSLREAERFDPSTGNFTVLPGLLTVAREAHTATTLPDGMVLLVGGLTARGFRFYNTAERFDPGTGRFTGLTPTLSAPRAFHASVLLPNGRGVLVVGGDSGMGELATAERFDLGSSRFVPTANNLAHPAKAVAAALLPDGRVLVAGGANATDHTLVDAALYDPATDRFAPAGSLSVRRMAHALTPLADGRVLASGGWSDATTPSASTDVLEVYDPRSDRWRTLPVRLAASRQDHRAVLLRDCRIVLLGGERAVGSNPPSAPLQVEVLTVPTRW